MASKAKKENIIILPNKDKLPIGKIKDISKFLNIVSAEYGIEKDVTYFKIEKGKYAHVLSLQFIPKTVSEIFSVNAKKFIVFELAKMGYGCVLKTDEELNKKALAINNLINAIDDFCKETINSKLNAMLDIPGELDYLLDQMITDPQFNSIKYTVLDESKNSCLLCVNGDGLFVRSLEVPYEVVRKLSWQDIMTIKTKGNKLIFRKKIGEDEELVCINKKTVFSAHNHLLKYLQFLGNVATGEVKRDRSSWFGSFAQRIRQSFSRRPRTHHSEPSTSIHSPLSKSTTAHYRERAPPNSIVPGSSIVSDDCTDNVCSLIEPSIKTNSTHDVSLGSSNSYRPSTSLYEQQNQSLVRLAGQDDHMSVKTTSTYEVSLDSGPMPRTLSNFSKGDHDSSGFGMSSFGQNNSKKTPPVTQLKDSILFGETTEIAEEAIIPQEEIPKLTAHSHESKNFSLVPPKPPIRTSEIQPAFSPEVYYPKFETIKQNPPPPPTRFTDYDVLTTLEPANTYSPHISLQKVAVEPIIGSDRESLDNSRYRSAEKVNLKDLTMTIVEETETKTNNNKDEINLSEAMSPIKEDITLDFSLALNTDSSLVYNNSTNTTSQNPTLVTFKPPSPIKITETKIETTKETTAKESILLTMKDLDSSPNVVLKNSSLNSEKEKDLETFSPDNQKSFQAQLEIQESGAQSDIVVKSNKINILQDDDMSKATTAILTKEEQFVEKEQPKVEKVECKLPIAQKKSIPSPKIQRPSRIPSVPSSRDPPSPTSSAKLITKVPSPSDKENYNSSINKNGSSEQYPDMDDTSSQSNDNFTRFEKEEYTLDSKTTITSVSTVGDSITKKSTKTEISTVKSSGIPAPKQYKTTTTITSTVKKPSNSPVPTPPKSSGIPRMAPK